MVPLAALLLALLQSSPTTPGAETSFLRRGDTIALVGGGLGERLGRLGHLEAALHERLPGHRLRLRTLAWPGDTVSLRPRPLNFGSLPEHLDRVRASVVLLFFGGVEAFDGPAGIEAFERDLAALVRELRERPFDGVAPPRIALVSPIAHEDLGPPLPDPTDHNESLRLYTAAMARVADEQTVGFVDLLGATLEHDGSFTTDGIRLSPAGSAWVAEGLAAQLIPMNDGWSLDVRAGDERCEVRGAALLDVVTTATALRVRLRTNSLHEPGSLTVRGLEPGHYRLLRDGEELGSWPHTGLAGGVEVNPEVDARLDALRADLLAQAVEKEQRFFHRYRAVNGEYVYGRRKEPFGVVNFPDEMRRWDELVRESEELAHRLAEGMRVRTLELERVPVIAALALLALLQEPNNGGDVDLASADPDVALARITAADGYEVNLFASERDFPIGNAVAIRFDARGRAWVLTMPTYPQLLPGDTPRDKLVILEDTDGDGTADAHTVFADDLYLPTGFELGDGGAYVAQQPDLVFLRDTDGDDVADERRILLSGFGTEDSHHAIGAFVWDPGGGLYFQEGTFHHSQVETPWGPVRLVDAGVFRFEPKRSFLEVFVTYRFANPWGHTFDAWGQDFVSDASNGYNYFALPFTGWLPYPEKHPGRGVFTSTVRPTAGTVIVGSSHFPPEARGEFLVTNVIGFRGVKRHLIVEDGSGFTSEERGALIQSSDLNFRPVDLAFGPDGALYVADWWNPLIGHMQYSVRDPRRDSEHGRVWRVTATGRPLLEDPDIAGVSATELVRLLATPEDAVRYRVRRELRARPTDEVLAAVGTMLPSELDWEDPGYDHRLLELLWVQQGAGAVDGELLERVAGSSDHRARAAAVRVARHVRHALGEEATLDLLRLAIEDEHGRVRLEAVVALSWFHEARGAEAAEIALGALALELDGDLEYGLRETIRALAPNWRAALLAGEPFCPDDPEGLAYVLARLDTEALLELPSSDPVDVEVLARHDAVDSFRRSLIALADRRGTDLPTELAAAIERADARGGGHADHLLGELFGLLLRGHPNDLRRALPALEALAAHSSRPSTRGLVAATRIAGSASPEAAWTVATKSAGDLGDFLGALPLVADDALRAALYTRVEALARGTSPNLPAPQPLRGRYVRVELPGESRTLTLAELEVFVGSENVAPRGSTAQSSVAWGGVAAKAVDGNKSGAYEDGGQTHTLEGVPNPWWELDLGEELAIDRIVLTNRDERDGVFASRLDGFVLRLLDDERRTVLFASRPRAPERELVLETGDARLWTRRAAARALGRMGVRSADTADVLVELFGDSQLRDEAVGALGGVALERWRPETASRLADALVAWIEDAGARARASNAARSMRALAEDVATLLPGTQAARLRRSARSLGPQVVRIRPVRDALLYDKREITVEAGRPVELVFENTDIMPHNLIVAAQGKLAEVGRAAEAMSSEPDAWARGFVPELESVLWATRLIDPGQAQTLSFDAPDEIGDYPYVCTFPGHWVRMNGVMHVVRELDPTDTGGEPGAAEDAPTPREFVRNWRIEDFTAVPGSLEVGRSRERGRAVFEQASCIRCHTIDAEGGTTGPVLTSIAETYAPFELLGHLLDPSKKVEPRYLPEVVVTVNGAIHSGLVVSEDTERLLLHENPYQEVSPVEIPLDEIEDRWTSNLSPMPEGLLSTFRREEILDLLAYLVAPR